MVHELISWITTHLVEILGEKWLPTSLSLFGGVLGFISFILQLPKSLKPIAINTGNVIFSVQEHASGEYKRTTLKDISLSLSISNSTKSFGIIEDIFVRVYTLDSFNPDTAIYFPTKTTSGSIESPFSPITLGPHAQITSTICFGRVEGSRSEKPIDKSKNYVVDVFYKLHNRKKPTFIPSIITFNSKNDVNDLMELTNITEIGRRDQYICNLDPIYHNRYRGIMGQFFVVLVAKIKFRIIQYPVKILLGLFENIYHLIIYLISNCVAYLIKRPLLIWLTLKSRKISIKTGSPQNRPFTEQMFHRVIGYLRKIIEPINAQNQGDQAIQLTSDGGGYILERNQKKLKIYISGDLWITASTLEQEREIDLRFSLQIGKWGQRFWIYQEQPITPYNMAMMIFNYFSLHSIYIR